MARTTNVYGRFNAIATMAFIDACAPDFRRCLGHE
jgi:hypothetical protein